MKKNIQLSSLVILLLIPSFLLICSCRKCEKCYLDETDQNGVVHTSSLGKKCGKELKDIDGKTYIVTSGTAKSYCK